MDGPERLVVELFYLNLEVDAEIDSVLVYINDLNLEVWYDINTGDY